MGWPVPSFATGLAGIRVILRFGRLSSIVEVKRIVGPVFNSREAAEEHGLRLCKEWIDKRP